MGIRSPRYREHTNTSFVDPAIALAMVFLGISMICYPILLQSRIHMILFGLRLFYLTRNPGKLRQNWLQLHLGNMTGAYISATSAFFVVNKILPGIWNWFVPSVVGGCYIAYWISSVSKQKASQSL